jgi:hypothetical protein
MFVGVCAGLTQNSGLPMAIVQKWQAEKKLTCQVKNNMTGNLQFAIFDGFPSYLSEQFKNRNGRL